MTHHNYTNDARWRALMDLRASRGGSTEDGPSASAKLPHHSGSRFAEARAELALLAWQVAGATAIILIVFAAFEILERRVA